MENQSGVKRNILKEYASYIKGFFGALVGNDEEIVYDVDSIPDLEEYKSKNAGDASIQEDIEKLTKFQKAIEKKSMQAGKSKNAKDSKLDEAERTKGYRTRVMMFKELDKEKE